MGATTSPERQLEEEFIETLVGLKYGHRPDVRDRAALERNFRDHFEALNRVRLTDGEFRRPLDGVVTPDVFAAAQTLRGTTDFVRDDGTPLNYTLVNTADWCKNTFEVVSQAAFKWADQIVCASHNATDGSLQFVQGLSNSAPVPISILEFPEHTVYRHGFSYMKNAMVERAEGDWIVCLDADEEMDIDKDAFYLLARNAKGLSRASGRTR